MFPLRCRICDLVPGPPIPNGIPPIAATSHCTLPAMFIYHLYTSCLPLRPSVHICYSYVDTNHIYIYITHCMPIYNLYTTHSAPNTTHQLPIRCVYDHIMYQTPKLTLQPCPCPAPANSLLPTTKHCLVRIYLLFRLPTCQVISCTFTYYHQQHGSNLHATYCLHYASYIHQCNIFTMLHLLH